MHLPVQFLMSKNKQSYEVTPTPWLTLLLVLGKIVQTEFCVNQVESKLTSYFHLT